MDKVLSKLRRLVARRAEGFETASGHVDVRAMIFNIGGYRIVLAIVLLVGLYYLLLASDRYATSSQVYIKSTNSSAISIPTVPGLLATSSERQDALTMQEYIRSPDMLNHLEKSLDVKNHFTSSDWDWFSRMGQDVTEEEFLDYYHSRLDLELNPESSILTITAQGFTAEFSQKMVAEIIAESESFINRISQKIAEEEISFVQRELDRSRTALDTVRRKILLFQNENNMLDPGAQSAAMQGVVHSLEAELVSLQAEQKALASYLNEDAAELVALNDRIGAISSQLSEERLRMASADSDEKINKLTASFRELELELQFAQDVYKSTLASYEQTPARGL